MMSRGTLCVRYHIISYTARPKSSYSGPIIVSCKNPSLKFTLSTCYQILKILFSPTPISTIFCFADLVSEAPVGYWDPMGMSKDGDEKVLLDGACHR